MVNVQYYKIISVLNLEELDAIPVNQVYFPFVSSSHF